MCRRRPDLRQPPPGAQKPDRQQPRRKQQAGRRAAGTTQEHGSQRQSHACRGMRQHQRRCPADDCGESQTQIQSPGLSLRSRGRIRLDVLQEQLLPFRSASASRSTAAPSVGGSAVSVGGSTATARAAPCPSGPAPCPLRAAPCGGPPGTPPSCRPFNDGPAGRVRVPLPSCAAHTVTSSTSVSSMTGPMPGTASKSDGCP